MYSKQEIIDDFKVDMKDYFGFKLKRRQIKKYLKGLDKEHLKTLRECGVDTFEREQFAQWLAEEIVGPNYSWPNGTTPKKESKEFFAKLKENAPKMGYKIRKGVLYEY